MTTPKTPRKSTAKSVSINVQLPAPVHRKLRLKALNEGMTLADAVTAAVTEWTR